MDEKYRKAFAEVMEVLNNTEIKLRTKVPDSFIKFLGENADKTHGVLLVKNKKLLEQDLLNETKAILSIIYRDYMCEEDRKQELLKIKQEYYNLKSHQILEKKENLKIETNQEIKNIRYNKIKDKIRNIFMGGEKK